MRIALFQFEPLFGEPDANLAQVEAALSNLRADLVVLPELCLSGYQFLSQEELLDLAEPATGPSLRRLTRLAGRIGGALVAGFAEREGTKVYNSAALLTAEGSVSVYRKVHLFADEKRLFSPGDRGFPVFEISGVRLGMMICFDWLFPEAARSLALGGAQLLAHPANLVLPYCQSAMPVRALENRVFTLTCNRFGLEDRIGGPALRFTGRSRICSPAGLVLAEAPEDRPALITVEIDPAQALDKHLTPHNDLFGDLRPDQYRRGPGA